MPNRSPAEAQYPPDDEISLREIWQVLVRYKWLVLGMPAIAVAVALVVSFLLKPVWEATAVVQVGQVGQVGQAGQLIEPVARVVERLKVRSFGDAVLAGLGVPRDEKNPLAHLFRHSLQVKPLPAADLIEVRVRGYSRQEASQWADAIFEKLHKIHAELAAPTIQRLKQQMAEVTQQITQTQTARDALFDVTTRLKRHGGPDAFMEQIVLANTLVMRDAELRALEQTKRVVEEQLSPVRTYPTSLMGEVYVANDPVAPKKGLIVALAGVLGLVLGVFAAFVLGALGKDPEGHA